MTSVFIDQGVHEVSPSNSSFCSLGHIEVTSPEQYVPICLAQNLPGTIENFINEHTNINRVSLDGRHSITLPRPTINKLRSLHGDEYKQEVRRVLGEILDQPMLKSYSIPGGLVSSYGEGNMSHVFFGTGRCNGASQVYGTELAGMGILGSITERYNDNPSSDYYTAVQLPYVTGASLHIKALILVKAKKLNYVRACALLNRRMILNCDEFRLLVNKDLSMTGSFYGELYEYSNVVGVPLEVVPGEELLKFVMTPIVNKDASKYLADVKLALDNPRFDTLLT